MIMCKEKFAAAIDKEVRNLIEAAYNETTEMLKNNMDKLDLIANALLERETLEGAELDQLLKEGVITDKPAEPEEQPPIAPTNTITGPDDGSGPKIVYISRQDSYDKWRRR
jgi:cell division protease FtsH